MAEETRDFWSKAKAWFKGGRSGWFRPLEIVTPLTAGALDKYYEHVRNGLTKDMDFLRRPIAWRRRWSNLIKFVALVALAVGILLPIIQPGEGDFLFLKDRTGAEIALVAVAAGGLLFLLDRLFNVSGSWTRLMLAELQVQKLLIRLQFEWAKRRPTITDSNVAAEGVAMIDLLQAASVEANAVMEAQKRTWATELDTAAAALSARLETQQTTLAALVQQQQAERKAGALNIRIDKPGDLEGPVKIRVNAVDKEGSQTPQASYGVTGVPSGLARVTVTAKRKAPPGGEFRFEKAIDVPADGVADVAVAV